MLVTIEKLQELGGHPYSVRVKQHIDFASGITEEVISSIKDTDIPHAVIDGEDKELVIREDDMERFESEVVSQYGRNCSFKYWRYT